jgi:hypothetical protein
LEHLAEFSEDRIREMKSYNRYSEARSNYYDLLRLAEVHGVSRQKFEARKVFIVSLVSALEVFLKELIIERHGKWDKEGFSKLLTEKVTLDQAYNIFKVYGVKREVIVAKTQSFQNLENISHVFNCLTSKKHFLNDLEEYKWELDNGIFFQLKKMSPNWRKDLSDLFDLRHKIVHENTKALKIEKKQNDSFIDVTGTFGMILTMFVFAIEHKVA